MEDGADEPRHPGHRGRPGAVQRRHLLSRLPPDAQGRLRAGQSALQPQRLGRQQALGRRALEVWNPAERQRQRRVDSAYHPPSGPDGACGRRAGQRLAVEPERRRGRHPATAHRGRPGGQHRGHASAVVLYDADSRLDLVLQQGQDTAGPYALHRRAQPRDDGHTQAARADRLRVGGSGPPGRHPAHRRHLLGLCRGAPEGGAGLLRRGDDRGDCGAGLYSDTGALCGYRGAGGGFGTLRGEDGAADGRAFGFVRAVARSGGGDPPAVGKYRV